MCRKNDRSALIISLIAAMVFGLVLAVFGTSQAANLLTPRSGDLSQIHITSYQVQVVINNGIARTEVDQVRINTCERDIEAIYSLPPPKQASFAELGLWNNSREVVVDVLEQ